MFSSSSHYADDLQEVGPSTFFYFLHLFSNVRSIKNFTFRCIFENEYINMLLKNEIQVAAQKQRHKSSGEIENLPRHRKCSLWRCTWPHADSTFFQDIRTSLAYLSSARRICVCFFPTTAAIFALPSAFLKIPPWNSSFVFSARFFLSAMHSSRRSSFAVQPRTSTRWVSSFSSRKNGFTFEIEKKD